MRRSIISMLIACLAIAGPFALSPVGALDPLERVTVNEAMTVAENWVFLMTDLRGSWGKDLVARAVDCEEIRVEGRLLGYYCPVMPVGYVVVSPSKLLTPVMLFSDCGYLDMSSDEGMAEFVKDIMGRAVDALERQAESASADPSQEPKVRSPHGAWEQLMTTSRGSLCRANYSSGGVLIDSAWDQGPPYNDQIPPPPAGDDCTALRCLVGCVATAGAQIMRYWNWPPFGVGSPYSNAYDWPNMPDVLDASSTPAQVNAVAELCREVGIAVDMDYCGDNTDGCQSWSDHPQMRTAFIEDFRYHSDANNIYRYSNGNENYDSDEWFDLMKAQFNLNRPVQYGISTHSLIADGWCEVTCPNDGDGNPLLRGIHINNGHGPNSIAWWSVDAIPDEDDDGEFLRDIYPAQSLGSLLSSNYMKQPFNYRYFDQDATGSATFFAGQFLQFLPGITVTSNYWIRFLGSPTDNTILFTRGDATRGIRIYDGAIRLNNGGSITFP